MGTMEVKEGGKLLGWYDSSAFWEGLKDWFQYCIGTIIYFPGK